MSRRSSGHSLARSPTGSAHEQITANGEGGSQRGSGVALSQSRSDQGSRPGSPISTGTAEVEPGNDDATSAASQPRPKISAAKKSAICRAIISQDRKSSAKSVTYSLSTDEDTKTGSEKYSRMGSARSGDSSEFGPVTEGTASGAQSQSKLSSALAGDTSRKGSAKSVTFSPAESAMDEPDSRASSPSSKSHKSSKQGSAAGSRTISPSDSGTKTPTVGSGSKSGTGSGISTCTVISNKVVPGSRSPSTSRKSSAKSGGSSKAQTESDEYYIFVGKQSGSESLDQSTSKEGSVSQKPDQSKRKVLKHPKETRKLPPKRPKGKQIRYQEPQVSTDAEPSTSKKPDKPLVDLRKQPQWYQEMDENELKMFSALYEILDYETAKNVTVEKICSEVGMLDVGVNSDDVQEVFHTLGRKSRERIPFDEFLYTMHEINQKIQSDRETPDTRPSGSDLTRAVKRHYKTKSSADIRRHYENMRKKSPHVMDCYTAGAKLYGMTDRQLKEEMSRLRRTLRGSDISSPYAQVQPFVCQDFEDELERKRRRSASRGRSYSRSRSLLSPSTAMLKEPSSFAVSQYPTMRPHMKSYNYKDTQDTKFFDRSGKPPRKASLKKKPGWNTPIMMTSNTPLPRIEVTDSWKPTIDDVGWIRKHVDEVLTDYYTKVKKKSARDALKYWWKLYPETIQSKTLRGLFLASYRSYFPFEPTKVQAKCPWYPDATMKPKIPGVVPDPHNTHFLSRMERYREIYGQLPRQPPNK